MQWQPQFVFSCFIEELQLHAAILNLQHLAWPLGQRLNPIT